MHHLALHTPCHAARVCCVRGVLPPVLVALGAAGAGGRPNPWLVPTVTGRPLLFWAASLGPRPLRGLGSSLWSSRLGCPWLLANANAFPPLLPHSVDRSFVLGHPTRRP
jgi:hypothetical protein